MKKIHFHGKNIVQNHYIIFFREIAQIFFCVYMIHFELWVVKLQKKISRHLIWYWLLFYLRLSFFNRTPSIGRSRGSLSSKQILIGYQAINLFFGRITYQTTTSWLCLLFIFFATPFLFTLFITDEEAATVK